MKVKLGKGKTHSGPGVDITLTGEEVAEAISAYLVSRGVKIDGPRTICVNGELCDIGTVHVDPFGKVVWRGEEFYGRGYICR